MKEDKSLDSKNPIREEIDSIVEQYQECMKKVQHFHNLAQKCLGAIEALQKIEKGEVCQDSEKEVKKT